MTFLFVGSCVIWRLGNASRIPVEVSCNDSLKQPGLRLDMS